MSASAGLRLAELAATRPTAAVAACYAGLDPHAPDDYRQLAALLVDHWRARGVAAAGIGGGQGAGKSTLGKLLEAAGAAFGLRVQVLGLDDFYLTRAERARLAETTHPLLATRGPPGTHAAEAARHAIAALQVAGAVRVPQFDKGKDDRARFITLYGPVDIVVLEGWCVGAPPAGQGAPEEANPLNALERAEDADGRWRAHVESALRAEYATLFAALDSLVFLQVPNLDAVRRWRLQQENERPPAQRMNAADVSRFVAHYERITRRMLAALPSTADVVVELNTAHRVVALRFADGVRKAERDVTPKHASTWASAHSGGD